MAPSHYFDRAANQYGTSVFCTDFTCKIREYEFGLQNTEIELCQFCHLRYYCQNKAYLFWVANQSRFVVFYALKPSNTSLIRSRPNQIADPGPKSGPARKSESRGPENGVSRWRRPNSDIYSQNHHFGLVYDMIYQFLGMEAKNYKFGIFCQQCHPSLASGDADIRPRNASQIHTCHLFTS